MGKYKQQGISTGFIKCVSCDETKGLDNFYMNKGYYNYKCKECHKGRHKETYLKVVKDVNVKEVDFIKCNMCGEEKPSGNYLKNSNGYFIKKCRVCRCVKNKVQPIPNDYKVCSKCNLELPISEFYKRGDTLKNPCRKCKSEIHKKWRQTEDAKKKIKDSNKRYESKIVEGNRIIREEKNKIREELKRQKEIIKEEKKRIIEEKKRIREEKKLGWEKLMEYYKTDEWKKIKKEKEREKKNLRWKCRWNEDEMFAMKVRLRNLIRNSFRRQGYKKFDTSTEEVVGMTYDEFKEYLESKFVDGMSWDNRGDWHIDHIIPLSSAGSEDELKLLCHYSNLQPLWAEDNLKKGDNIL
jgi:hypothetical protein